MLETLLSEDLMPLKQARRLPFLRGRNGKQLDLATIYRWTMPNGCRGVRLESCQIGGMRMTSREAVVRFIAALSGRPEETRPATPKQREREVAAADRELAAAGI